MNLKDLIQFSDQDGKVVIVGDDGEVKGVFLSFVEYQRLTSQAVPAKQVPAGPDPEKINREIVEAQLKDTIDIENKNLEVITESLITESVITEPASSLSTQQFTPPAPIKNILAKRAKDLFMNQPYGRQEPPSYDLRQEVMDPAFGLPSTQPVSQPVSQPVVETDSDEEIKPNFDDI